MTKLADQTCIPCQGDVPALSPEEQTDRLKQLSDRWSVVDEHHLSSEYTFPNFVQALAFTNAIGAIAEYEGHHPDILLSWGKVGITIWTHKIDALTHGDFVLAAKVDQAFETKEHES